MWPLTVPAVKSASQSALMEQKHYTLVLDNSNMIVAAHCNLVVNVTHKHVAVKRHTVTVICHLCTCMYAV